MRGLTGLMIWSALLTIILSSCIHPNAPKLERNIKVYIPDDSFHALITTMKDGYECPGTVEVIQGREVCVVLLDQAEKEFVCTPNEDYQLVLGYINTLLLRCNDWNDAR